MKDTILKNHGYFGTDIGAKRGVNFVSAPIVTENSS